MSFELLQIRLDCFCGFGFCDMPSHHPWISNSTRLRCLQGNWYKVPSCSIWWTCGEEKQMLKRSYNNCMVILKKVCRTFMMWLLFFSPNKAWCHNFFLKFLFSKFSLFKIVCYLHDDGFLFAYKFDGVFPCPIDKIWMFIRELDSKILD